MSAHRSKKLRFHGLTMASTPYVNREQIAVNFTNMQGCLTVRRLTHRRDLPLHIRQWGRCSTNGSPRLTSADVTFGGPDSPGPAPPRVAGLHLSARARHPARP